MKRKSKTRWTVWAFFKNGRLLDLSPTQKTLLHSWGAASKRDGESIERVVIIRANKG